MRTRPSGDKPVNYSSDGDITMKIAKTKLLAEEADHIYAARFRAEVETQIT